MSFKLDMKKIIPLALLSFLFLLLPVFSFADTHTATTVTKPEVKPTGITYDCANEKQNTEYGECDFNDLIRATKKVVNWGVTFTLMFSVVVIAYAGFNLMISGDNPGKRTEAKKMFTSVAKGIILILAAWLIVNLITTSLLRKDIVDETTFPLR